MKKKLIFTLSNFNLTLQQTFSHKNTKQLTILIFDSGVGGLSIFSKVKQILPNARYLYMFDNQAFPYGEKSKQFITDRVITIISIMSRLHQFDLIIIACNTVSTTVSMSMLRALFPFPIIGVVPAIKLAAKSTRNKVVGLLATRGTLESNYTHNLINQFARNCRILHLKAANLVSITEAKLHGKLVSMSALFNILSPWLGTIDSPDTIVLGCTHFPLLNFELRKILPRRTNFIDSGLAVAQRVLWTVKQDINLNMRSKIIAEGPNKVYCSAITSKTITLAPTLKRYGFSSLEVLNLNSKKK
ncbi:glutamate racemase [Sodalis sp. CWE]|uniref:glutamate racemase n=1 Tax=Sodalis sp. CWE TaxID=2803816 RepID=UPI001C7CB81B|nr:glutamate racemase [Sodalis sp. CWE]MBX4181218.1 glutamate racemase [Sodalis sp. CWE]